MRHAGSITDEIGVPPNIQRAIICYGFDHSPYDYPKGRSDETGAQILKRTLQNELLKSYFPIVVTSHDTSRWLEENLNNGAFINKEKLRYSRTTSHADYIGDPFLPLPVLCQAERIAERYRFYRKMSFQKLRLAMIQKICWWSRLVDELPRQSIYLNANAPHTLDDYIAFQLFKARGMATFCIYRLPLFQGLSSRLMVFTDPFNQKNPIPAHDRASEKSTSNVIAEDLTQVLSFIREGSKNTKPHNGTKLEARKIRTAIHMVRIAPRKAKKQLKKKLDRNILGNAAKLIYYQHAVSRTLPRKDFIYYPLHMQPEASSMPLAGIYADQQVVVEALSNALPRGLKLVVKEHPLQFTTSDKLSFRSVEFYSRLKSLDNVVLAHQKEPAAPLIRNSLAAVTLTGTTALEALAYRRYCFVLGSSVLARSPNALVPQNQTDLRRQLARLSKNQLPPIAEDDIADFLKWIEKHSVFGYLDPDKHPRLEAKFGKEQNVAAVSGAVIHAIRASQSPADSERLS